MFPSLVLVLITRLWSRLAMVYIFMSTQKSDHHAGHTISLEDLLNFNAGQVGFGFIGVLVNLILQLTRKK